MACLTIIDVAGIQKYIFGSNRLKEIIGASEIVAQATSWWIFDVLREDFTTWNTNLNAKSTERKSPFVEINEGVAIEDKNLDAEIIYAGGGNTLILFADKNKAVEFTKKYTRKLLKDARGLEAVIAHSEKFQMDETSADGKPKILEIIDDTFEKLNVKKSNRQTSAPLFGLSVTAQCVSTGGAATSFDEQRKNYISTESHQKQKCAKPANERLKNEVLRQLDFKGLEVPLDFDNLGRTKGEASYIAVVHTDGNGMGEKIKAVRMQAENGEPLTNRKCVENLRRFSKSIYSANLQAMETTINELLYLTDFDNDKNNFVFTTKSISPTEKEFDLIQNENKTETYFPFRPLIFGGDDLTFVCDGRIALGLTAFYLKELQKIDLTDGNPIYARAGISIVKSHYPFARAYRLAETLADNTKELIKEIDESRKKVIAMDWHVAMSGLLGSLEEIREKEYTLVLDKTKKKKNERRKGKLEMRPVSLFPQRSEWQTWQTFSQIINEFQGEEWDKKRNKLKELREVLRRGRSETKDFLMLRKMKLPILAETDGWETGGCVHFDAIEMLDLYFPICKPEAKQDE